MSQEANVPILVYSSSRGKARNAPISNLVASASLFAAGHLLLETAIGYWVEVCLKEAATPQPNPVLIDRIWRAYSYSMFVEVEIATVAALVFFLISLLLKYIARCSLGPFIFLRAIALGTFFCVVRWGIWWFSVAMPYNYSENMDWLFAIMLAALFPLGLIGLGKREAP